MKRQEKLKGQRFSRGKRARDSRAQDKVATRRAERREGNRKMEDADQHRAFYGWAD